MARVSSAGPDGYLPEHGTAEFAVAHYDLTLDYKVGPNRLTGTAVLTARAATDLSRIVLDLAGLRTKRVLVDGKAAKYTDRGEKLQVNAPSPIPAGASFTVEVGYQGNPRPVSSRWGDVGWDELTDGSLVASQPVGAPSWFPCNDHPADKASYRVAITVASTYYVAVSANLVGKTSSGASTRWVFDRPEPTSTYLMSVQIGPYEQVELDAGPVPVRAAVPRRLRTPFGHDFGRQGRMLTVLSELFGPYPFDEYAVVVTDDDLDDPIEAQGMAIFGANHVDGRRTHERLVVHELAHQWFGNSLTVSGWRHIWLNEGFATYTEWLWSEAVGERTVAGWAAHWHLRMQAAPAAVRIADPGVDRMFDEQVYKRGALTLHALRAEMGDPAFFALLRAWPQQYRHGLVSTLDFVAMAEAYAGRGLASVFGRWIDSVALPPLP